MGEQAIGPWTDQENQILMDAMDLFHGATSALINHIQEQTRRSRKSVERRLIKIGYLSGRLGRSQSRSQKWGFVR